MVLTSEPTGPVVVRIGSDKCGHDVQPRLLQYTASTWDTAQTVRVQADADDDVQAATATLTHTAAGGDYHGAGSGNVGGECDGLRRDERGAAPRLESAGA